MKLGFKGESFDNASSSDNSFISINFIDIKFEFKGESFDILLENNICLKVRFFIIFFDK